MFAADSHDVTAGYTHLRAAPTRLSDLNQCPNPAAAQRPTAAMLTVDIWWTGYDAWSVA